MTTTEYTPTTEEVRQSYTSEPCGDDACLVGPARNAEFDRWLAAHDAALMAAATARSPR